MHLIIVSKPKIKQVYQKLVGLNADCGLCLLRYACRLTYDKSPLPTHSFVPDLTLFPTAFPTW